MFYDQIRLSYLEGKVGGCRGVSGPQSSDLSGTCVTLADAIGRLINIFGRSDISLKNVIISDCL